MDNVYDNGGTVRRVPISVVIPVYRATEKFIKTINRLLDCEPQPDEIIVHIDYGDQDTLNVIKNRYPSIIAINSKERVGPGGGRDVGIRAARNSIVVSFDDDSYPLDKEFFDLVIEEFKILRQAAIIGMAIYENEADVEPRTPERFRARGFVGCGCAYRREVYCEMRGYLPLEHYYGAEEADLVHQMVAKKKEIHYTRMLRVYHDIDYKRRDRHIALEYWLRNVTLTMYLHYPYYFWPIAGVRLLRLSFVLRKRLPFKNIVKSILGIKSYISRYRHLRKPVKGILLVKHLLCNRQPV